MARAAPKLLAILGGAGLLGAAAWGCAVGYSTDPVEEPVEAGSLKAEKGPADTGSTVVVIDSGVVEQDSGVIAGDGGGPPPSCKPTNTCLAATSLAAASGDTGSVVRNATGERSEWLMIRITEDDNSVIGTKLKAKVDLTSAAGSNYDLYVYLPGSDVRECAAYTKQSASTGATDSVSVDWGEGTVANGDDDGRTLSIEVRHASGACDASHKWTLKVSGNP